MKRRNRIPPLDGRTVIPVPLLVHRVWNLAEQATKCGHVECVGQTLQLSLDAAIGDERYEDASLLRDALTLQAAIEDEARQGAPGVRIISDVNASLLLIA